MHCNNNLSAQSSTSYPTRLIDVSRPPLRLVLTENLKEEERLPYIALSHCWGGYRQFVTQSDSIAERQHGFAMADLPCTFRDAVFLTRSLKIRYLWIDSLCIIQDDVQDWRIESSRMCDIYSNAYLTIAATVASDDSQGFLRQRRSRIACLELAYPNQETIRLFLKPDKANDEYFMDVCDGPLHSRAWTLQERLLSRRILGFASNQIYWECRGHKLQKESGNRSTPPGYLALLQPFKGDEDLRGLWHRLVEEYTERSLTDPQDKLVALEGLVKRFAATSGDTFVAGLWKRHFLDDLMWRPYPGVSHSPSPVYRAPSWSWASMDGLIWYHDRETWRNISHAVVERINVEIVPTEQQPGYVIIQGSMLNIPLPPTPSETLNFISVTVTWNPLLTSNSSPTLSPRLSCKVDVVLDDKDNYATYGPDPGEYMGVILNIQMESKERQSTTAGFEKCRAVGLLLKRSGLESKDSSLYPRNLAQLAEQTSGEFLRIGLFESEWLDMWTLQQLCTSTRRERIVII